MPLTASSRWAPAAPPSCAQRCPFTLNPRVLEQDIGQVCVDLAKRCLGPDAAPPQVLANAWADRSLCSLLPRPWWLCSRADLHASSLQQQGAAAGYAMNLPKTKTAAGTHGAMSMASSDCCMELSSALCAPAAPVHRPHQRTGCRLRACWTHAAWRRWRLRAPLSWTSSSAPSASSAVARPRSRQTPCPWVAEPCNIMHTCVGPQRLRLLVTSSGLSARSAKRFKCAGLITAAPAWLCCLAHARACPYELGRLHQAQRKHVAESAKR